MPANGRRDLIRRSKVKCVLLELQIKNPKYVRQKLSADPRI